MDKQFIDELIEKAILKWQTVIMLDLNKDNAMNDVVKQTVIATCENIKKAGTTGKLSYETAYKRISKRIGNIIKQCE